MLPVNNNPYQPFRPRPGLRSARDATSSDNVSHATTVPLRPDEYYALWSEWEKNAPSGGGGETGHCSGKNARVSRNRKEGA
ncbi:leucine-rich repeat domain-containing protein [Serratia symbiotica]|uniref:leucine-rich repeat domain-containing protein n=1 Tax=Serratia symbiotica TaxID=138074 RepID=UPI000906E68A